MLHLSCLFLWFILSIFSSFYGWVMEFIDTKYIKFFSEPLQISHVGKVVYWRFWVLFDTIQTSVLPTPSTVLCTRCLRKWSCILKKAEGKEHIKHLWHSEYNLFGSSSTSGWTYLATQHINFCHTNITPCTIIYTQFSFLLFTSSCQNHAKLYILIA